VLAALRTSPTPATIIFVVGHSCLIVDDSQDFLASAMRLLEAEGMHVVGVGSGAEAARFLAANRVDVVLVDVDLGEEDGVAVASRIAAALEGPAAVVVISSHDELRDLPMPDGVAGFLPKDRLGAAAIETLVRVSDG
jgi:CheY-like chemotaxis protein